MLVNAVETYLGRNKEKLKDKLKGPIPSQKKIEIRPGTKE